MESQRTQVSGGTLEEIKARLARVSTYTTAALAALTAERTGELRRAATPAEALEIDPYCAICFNFMVEPVKFPARGCQHRFCSDCTNDMFAEDAATAKFTTSIARACPMCRAGGRIAKEDREEALRIDEAVQEKLREEHTEEFEAVYNTLMKTREFHAKLAFVEFEIGVRRVDEGRTFKWQAFVRAKDQEQRPLIDHFVKSVEFGVHKLYPSRSGRPTVVATNDFLYKQQRRQQKDKNAVEIATPMVQYKSTPNALPVTICLNDRLGFHCRTIRVECFGIESMEKNIEVAVKIEKESLLTLLNQKR